MRRLFNKSRILSWFLIFVFTLSSIPMAFAQPLTDISGHWAEKQISDWYEKGLIKGNADGTFKPNNSITRAEFAAMANRAFNFTESSGNSFSDVGQNSWFADAVSIASAAGYISGYGDGTFKPYNLINRQEAAVMIARIAKLDLNASIGAADLLADKNDLQQWSKGAIGAVLEKGLMTAYPDKTFRPLKPISRAEALVILDRAMQGRTEEVEKTETVETSIDGTVTLNGKGVQAKVCIFAVGSFQVLKELETDKNGSFKIEIKAGSYDITANTDTETTYKSNVIIAENQVTKIDLELEKAVVVKGVLNDKNGKEVKDATILFTTNPTFSAETNSKGEFSAAVIPNRTYTVRAYEPKEDDDPVIVKSELEVGSGGTQDIGILKAPFSVSPNLGGGGGGGSTQTSATVSTSDELSAALANKNIKTINFSKNITSNISLTRLVNLNFAGHTLTGNVSVNTNETGFITFSGSGNPSINGDLTVNTPNATVTNGIKISGTVTIVAVSNSTWNEVADGNSLTITDDNGATITIIGDPASITVTQDAGGNLTITVKPGATVGSITSNAPVNIVVSTGATVNEINAEEGSNGTTITNNGTIEDLTVNAPINLVANNPPDNLSVGETGSVNITGEEADKVPVVKVSHIDVTGVGNKTTVEKGKTLQMQATVSPPNATNKSVTWSVFNQSGAATINSTTGLLTATDLGTVKVRATANDGSSAFGEKEIIITDSSGPYVPEEPQVITGISVAARTTSTNGDKISVGSVTGTGKEYAVTVTGTGELETVTSPVMGDGKWFGLQLSPGGVTDITQLEYKTETQETFTALTAADVAEAGAAGQIVWWINGETEKTHNIYLKYSGEADDTAIKLSVTFKPYLKQITRADNEVTQDTGYTGGTELTYSFTGATKVLTIDANGKILPYYPQAGDNPPRGANWVGVAIPVPTGVEARGVSATINGEACTGLYFAEGKYIEYISVDADELTDNAASYTWVINWGSGYADETITINITNVGGLAGPPPVLDGTISQDPGKTGGDGVTVVITDNTATFSGSIDWYPADPEVGRNEAGNRVGVQITAPVGFDTTKTTVKIGENDYNWNDIEDGPGYFLWYPLVTAANRTFTAEMNWNGSTIETFTVVIAADAILESAPPAEIVRDAGSVTQDPGYTGGKGLIYTFAPDTKTLTITGGEVEYVVGTGDGFPPSSGNWVGVAIKAPVGFSGDISQLTIDGTPYSQPILSDLEKERGELWYYFKATESGDSHTLVIKWSEAYVTETIKVETSGLTLEPATSTEANVSNLSELQTALANTNITTINVTGDINAGAPVIVDRALTINGGGNSLTFSGLESISGTVDDGLIILNPATVNNLIVDAGLTSKTTWVGTYGIHVYKTTATLNGVTATGANGGILVNGSSVTLKGAINVSGNGFGGIESSKGVGVEETPVVNVTEATLTNNTEAYGLPTIWEDGVTGTVMGGSFTKDSTVKPNRVQYYLDPKNAVLQPKIKLTGVPNRVTTEAKIPEDANGKVLNFTQGNRSPIVVSLKKGSVDYPNVRVIVEGLDDGIQLIAMDTAVNWYNIVKTGWGPAGGFPLADAETNVFLIANKAGTYNATIKLIDVSASNAVLATATASVVAESPATDTTAPTLQRVTPKVGTVTLDSDENFVLTVEAYDAGGLYELEIDHSMENTLPEFSVYANEDNPYGTEEDKERFESYGVDVSYDDQEQKWTIDFGPQVTADFVENGGITFYIVIIDKAGNRFGSMSPTTQENTFSYSLTKLPPKTPVSAGRISQFNTFVTGVTLTTSEGKGTFEFGDDVEWPSDQEPNEELGADPDLVYVDLLVKAPNAKVTKVEINGNLVPLDDEINGTTPEGRLFYFPVAQIDDNGNYVGFSEEKTWNLEIKWYDDNDQLISIETLEVTRESYVPAG